MAREVDHAKFYRLTCRGEIRSVDFLHSLLDFQTNISRPLAVRSQCEAVTDVCARLAIIASLARAARCTREQ